MQALDKIRHSCSIKMLPLIDQLAADPSPSRVRVRRIERLYRQAEAEIALFNKLSRYIRQLSLSQHLRDKILYRVGRHVHRLRNLQRVLAAHDNAKDGDGMMLPALLRKAIEAVLMQAPTSSMAALVGNAVHQAEESCDRPVSWDLVRDLYQALRRYRHVGIPRKQNATIRAEVSRLGAQALLNQAMDSRSNQDVAVLCRRLKEYASWRVTRHNDPTLGHLVGAITSMAGNHAVTEMYELYDSVRCLAADTAESTQLQYITKIYAKAKTISQDIAAWHTCRGSKNDA